MNNRLKELREKAGLTQEGLAERVGTTHSTIQRLEAGTRRLTADWIFRLAPHLGCTPGEIIDFQGGPPAGEDEKRAAALVRLLTPDQRAAWFSVGHALAQQPKGRPSNDEADHKGRVR